MMRWRVSNIFKTRARKVLIGAMFLPLLAWGGFQLAITFWPYPAGIERMPMAGTFLEDRAGKPLAGFVNPDGQWQLPLKGDEISPHLKAAMIAVEDGRFQSHHGVDWQSTAGSLWEDLTHFAIRRGGSTLTMQLQRLRDPKPRTLFNKIEQAIRAEQIERKQSKDQILVEYLNRAPFGGNLVGAGAASWRYFGRCCADLSLAQAALLAGLPQSPNRLRPDRHPQPAKTRRDHVLNRMLTTHVIDQHEYDEAIAEPVDAAWHALPQDEKRGDLPTLQILASRFAAQSVRTTLDRDLEQQAYRAACDRLDVLKPSGVDAAAVVILDTPTAQCLAAISVCPDKASVDLTRAARSTGSTLKPLIYAAAFDAGITTPNTLLNDSPSAWPGYTPGNYDGVFHGLMPASEMLAQSRNIPALLMLQKVGVRRATGIMESFGLRTLSATKREPGLSLAIGGAEATPMELAEAYAALARGGIWKPVTFSPSQVIAPVRVMRAGPCWQVMRALSEMDRTQEISAEAASHHVAWKTGTSSGHRDAWCCAVTPRRTVIVWLGNPAGQGAMSLVGVDAAAPLALQLIASVDPPVEAWPAAKDVNRVASVHITPSAADRLVIASPGHGQKFLLVPELKPDQQRVKLQASSKDRLWWFVDDAPAGVGEVVWWSPSVGPHHIRAVDAAGRSATTEIEVRRAV